MPRQGHNIAWLASLPYVEEAAVTDDNQKRHRGSKLIEGDPVAIDTPTG
jgi:hypothetical protein